jgi:uncharacterized protein
MIKQLSEDEARGLLARRSTGRLGCVLSDGSPYIVPVNYIVSQNRIYVHSLQGRKIEAMRRNIKVCLQVDDVHDEYNWCSAIAFGQYQEVTDSAEREWAVRELLARFPHLTPVESVPVHDGQSSVVVFSIQIDTTSGVREA